MEKQEKKSVFSVENVSYFWGYDCLIEIQLRFPQQDIFIDKGSNQKVTLFLHQNTL